MQGLQQQQQAWKAIRIEHFLQEAGYFFPGVPFHLKPSFGAVEDSPDLHRLRELQECITAKILAELSHTDIGLYTPGYFETGVVEAPVMRQVGAYEDHITRAKPAHIVSDELHTLSFLDVYQFDLGVEMPAIVHAGNEIPADAERLSRFFGNFKQLRSHRAVKMEKNVITETIGR
jgi:hypothetical protein